MLSCTLDGRTHPAPLLSRHSESSALLFCVLLSPVLGVRVVGIMECFPLGDIILRNGTKFPRLKSAPWNNPPPVFRLKGQHKVVQRFKISVDAFHNEVCGYILYAVLLA